MAHAQSANYPPLSTVRALGVPALISGTLGSAYSLSNFILPQHYGGGRFELVLDIYLPDTMELLMVAAGVVCLWQPRTGWQLLVIWGCLEQTDTIFGSVRGTIHLWTWTTWPLHMRIEYAVDYLAAMIGGSPYALLILAIWLRHRRGKQNNISDTSAPLPGIPLAGDTARPILLDYDRSTESRPDAIRALAWVAIIVSLPILIAQFRNTYEALWDTQNNQEIIIRILTIGAAVLLFVLFLAGLLYIRGRRSGWYFLFAWVIGATMWNATRGAYIFLNIHSQNRHYANSVMSTIVTVSNSELFPLAVGLLLLGSKRIRIVDAVTA